MTERVETQPTFWIDIYVAGDLADARRICREWCVAHPICVTIEPVEFIYTGGAEAGVRVGIKNYPRFPSDPESLRDVAERLGRRLAASLSQHSVMLVDCEKTTWITTREQ